MSGWYQAVFVKSASVDAIQAALEELFVAELHPPTGRRIDVAEAAVSRRGWTLLLPVEPDFFLDTAGLGTTRLGRLARALRVPAYEVDVRDGVATTLFEADALGRLRISGSPVWAFDEDADAAPVENEKVSFQLLPVPAEVRARIERFDDDVELADYLGELAGFPRWRRDGYSTELIVAKV